LNKKRVALAILRSDPSEGWLAEDVDVLSRVLALQVVAHTPPATIKSVEVRNQIKQCLLDERWGDAVSLWIQHGGDAIDVYDDVEIWTDGALDLEQASFEIRMAPIFSENSEEGEPAN
jgi:hypothetical protein